MAPWQACICGQSQAMKKITEGDTAAEEVDLFKDVRVIRDELSGKGIKIIDASGDENQGPAHIMILDPDGNPILIDQHR
jgi:hypothetical protein